jgi:surface antigen
VSLPLHASTTGRRIATATLLTLSLGLAGCSTAIPLPGFISREDVAESVARFSSPLSPRLDSEDSRRALAALGAALDPQGPGAPVDWVNPVSGLKGSFMPLGEVFAQDRRLCRNFRAEIGIEKTMQGTGCRTSAGDWAVVEVRPAQRASVIPLSPLLRGRPAHPHMG